VGSPVFKTRKFHGYDTDSPSVSAQKKEFPITSFVTPRLRIIVKRDAEKHDGFDRVEYCLVCGAIIVLTVIRIIKLIGAELGSLFH
jgi:hypothetical protein